MQAAQGEAAVSKRSNSPKKPKVPRLKIASITPRNQAMAQIFKPPTSPLGDLSPNHILASDRQGDLYQKTSE